MNRDIESFKLIAIDADDTLWETQPLFDKVEEDYCNLLSKYSSYDKISQSLFSKECENMHGLGYGSKAFIISMIENAIEATDNKVTHSELLEIINKGKSLIEIAATPLEGVEETLDLLAKRKGKTQLIIFTKGDSKEQENKIFRSNLLRYFDDYKIYTDKYEEDYRRLLREFDCKIEQFLMIGNSFKSDIEPVLKMGGRAIHIPFYAPWKYEVVEEYEHENLIVIEQFRDLISIFDLL